MGDLALKRGLIIGLFKPTIPEIKPDRSYTLKVRTDAKEVGRPARPSTEAPQWMLSIANTSHEQQILETP